MRMPTNQSPIHPGEILLEEFLKPYEITPAELSSRIAVSHEQINAIINSKQAITTNIALRLSRLFGTSPELWLNGQIKWDIWHQLHGKRAEELKVIKPMVMPTYVAPTASHNSIDWSSRLP